MSSNVQHKYIGWAPELSNDQYHSINALGSSTIKLMKTSPKHFYAAWSGQKVFTSQQQARFDIGTCFHSVILEQNMNGFVRGPDVSSKAVKAWKEAKAEADALGKILLSPEEYERVLAGFDSFCEHPKAHKLVSQCQNIESSGFHLDAKSGLWCKFRPDGYCQDDVNGDFIFDYKTTQSLDYRSLQSAIFNYGYHISAAHYIAGVEALNRPIRHYYLCFQEVKAPYDTVMFVLDPQDIQIGREVRDNLLLKISDCLDKDYWPGISDQVQPISLPQWANEADEAWLKAGGQ